MNIEDDLKFLETEEEVLSSEQIRLKEKAHYKDLRRITGDSFDPLHRMRIDGRLPADSVSLEADLNHYINWLKQKIENKGGEDIMELQIKENLRSVILKNAELSLNIKERRGEVVHTEEILTLFVPLFTRLRGQLHAMANSFPECQQMVDSCLRQWNDIGKRFCKLADEEFSVFEHDLSSGDVLGLPNLLGLSDLEDI